MKALFCAVLASGAMFAQDQLVKDTKMLFEMTRTNLTKSAEKATEEMYAYRPTPEVRSFGEMIGHVADAQYLFCSAASGQANTPRNIEKTKKTKAELTDALKEAFAFCDQAYAGMTDQKAAEMVKFGRGERTRLGVLQFNSIHNYEHYGNLVTYFRMKGIVPPSSER